MQDAAQSDRYNSWQEGEAVPLLGTEVSECLIMIVKQSDSAVDLSWQ